MSKFGTALGIAGFVIGLPALVGFYYLGQAAAPPKETASAADLPQAARYFCGRDLRRSLKDPTSARFVDKALWPVSKDAAGRYVVAATVRAKNGFGALTVAHFTCRYKPAGGTLDLVDLREN